MTFRKKRSRKRENMQRTGTATATTAEIEAVTATRRSTGQGQENARTAGDPRAGLDPGIGRGEAGVEGHDVGVQHPETGAGVVAEIGLAGAGVEIERSEVGGRAGAVRRVVVAAAALRTHMGAMSLGLLVSEKPFQLLQLRLQRPPLPMPMALCLWPPNPRIRSVLLNFSSSSSSNHSSCCCSSSFSVPGQPTLPRLRRRPEQLGVCTSGT